MVRTAFILFLSFVLLPSAAYSKGSVSVGDNIPHNLELKSQNGETQNFSALVGKKGLVLVFVRSVDWCPYCQKQLIDLDKSTKRFNDFGYNVVSVSYDSPQAMRKFVTTNKPKMTLLSDPRSESIRAFGILNEDVAKGTVSYGVPYPGVYIVGKDKKVQAKFFEAGYKDRPSTDEILAKIEALNPPELPPMTMETMGTDPILPGEEFVEIPQEELPPLVLPGVSNTIDPITDIDNLEPPIVPDTPVIPETVPAPNANLEALESVGNTIPDAPQVSSPTIEAPIIEAPAIDPMPKIIDNLDNEFLEDLPQPDLPENGAERGQGGDVNVM